MNITKELMEKVNTAKTAEELLEMAKAESIELTAEEAAKYFADMHKSGELFDEELDNVAGGVSSGEASKLEGVQFMFSINQKLYGFHLRRLTGVKSGWFIVLDRKVREGCNEPFYLLGDYRGVAIDWYPQSFLLK